MIDEIRKDTLKYFTDERFSYHSRQHTEDVYEAVTAIGEHQKLDPKSLELLQIAALFHDTGYIKNPTYHEQIGADIAEAFLTEKNYPSSGIETVKKLILSTKMGLAPASELEGIIKDADMSHLGGDNYKSCSQALRDEMSNIQGMDYSDIEWKKKNLTFLENQKWHSKGAKKLYNKKKKANLAELKLEIKNEAKAADAQIPEKGIETMYRVALRNHNQLSKIADNKANIMLSITAIMLSLILSNLAPKIDSNEKLLIPTIVIIIVNLVTMFFAIMATRPKVSSAPYTRENFLNNKLNILFFGNFYKMPLEEFEWGMNQLMKDRHLLYSSLSKDLYFLGSVLAKKYQFLQYAYAVFMIGLIISTIAFVWAFMV